MLKQLCQYFSGKSKSDARSISSRKVAPAVVEESPPEAAKAADNGFTYLETLDLSGCRNITDVSALGKVS